MGISSKIAVLLDIPFTIVFYQKLNISGNRNKYFLREIFISILLNPYFIYFL